MYNKEPILLKLLRKSKVFYTKSGYTTKYVKLNPQQTNDYLYDCITKQEPLLISKFGTNELENYCAFLGEQNKTFIKDFYYSARNLKNFNPANCFPRLCFEAGFFPNNIEYGYEWKKLLDIDVPEIDGLVSYLKLEKYISKQLSNVEMISFDGFLKPFLFNKPWTSALKDKKVLIIHPFADSIKKQYDKRIDLYENPLVLPDFKELHIIKAVQSIADSKTNFKTWFDALEYMEKEIDKIDFDVALIGCGAYGMNLAAYCKRKGKIGLHMASYVQILFGIYGSRWEKDSSVNSFINENWIRPLESEKPENFSKVENGCYW